MTAKICGAKTRSGGTCQRPAMPNGRCNLHGGKSLGGIASPNFKTGRYSKYMGPGLKDTYDRAISDPFLLEMREEIALIDVRLSDLLERTKSGETENKWQKLFKVHAALRKAISEKDGEGINRGIVEIGAVIRAAQEEQKAWDEIYNVIEQRRRLVDSEHKHMIESRQVITAEAAMIMMSQLLNIIKTHVTDRDALNAISGDINRLITVGSA